MAQINEKIITDLQSEQYEPRVPFGWIVRCQVALTEPWILLGVGLEM